MFGVFGNAARMSSSEEIYIGGAAVGWDPVLDAGVDLSGSEAADSSSDPELSCMLGAGDGDKGKGKAKRRRVRPLVTTGRYWSLVGTRTRLGGVQTLKVYGVALLSWNLERRRGGDTASGPFGSIDYFAHSVHLLAVPADLPGDFDDALPASVVRAMGLCGRLPLAEPASGGQAMTMRAFLATEGAVCGTVSWLSSVELEALIVAPEFPYGLRVVAIHAGRTGVGRWQNPSGNVLKKWRRQYGSADDDVEMRGAPEPCPPSGSGPDDVLPCLFLPASAISDNLIGPTRRLTGRFGGKFERDPMIVLRALGFSSYLRSPQYFTEALDAADNYLGWTDAGPPPPRVAHDPSTSVLDRSLAQMDVLAMLLQRRCFTAWFDAGCIKCICLFSDASPVTGIEIQGMVAQIVFKNGAAEELILPGTSLAYGHTDSMAKSMALVWAIWLVAGPDAASMRRFCNHVISFTTDFGVEMHTLQVPDVADALVAWITGTPLNRLRPLIKHDVRQFPKALRMAGWSHTLGGVMKAVATKMDVWPQRLDCMRHLCKHFRNGTYRAHTSRKLRQPANLRRLLKGFTATFAKWRFETVTDVMTQLLPLCELCEDFMTEALWAHAQDQEEIKSFIVACKDVALWRWMAVNLPEIFEPLEDVRRWGMICECEEHVEERKRTHGRKFIKCPRTT